MSKQLEHISVKRVEFMDRHVNAFLFENRVYVMNRDLGTFFGWRSEFDDDFPFQPPKTTWIFRLVVYCKHISLLSVSSFVAISKRYF
jgi:hypothetical protein